MHISLELTQVSFHYEQSLNCVAGTKNMRRCLVSLAPHYAIFFFPIRLLQSLYIFLYIMRHVP